MQDETLQCFLADAAAQAEIGSDEVLARLFHLGQRDLATFTRDMRSRTKELFSALDYGLRIRNPGLHYAPRKNYLGYRREDADAVGAGERSQVFASVLRNNTTLDLVLPLNPATVSHLSTVRDLTGVGHHGVGDTRVTIGGPEQLEQFFVDFDFWLRPRTLRLK